MIKLDVKLDIARARASMRGLESEVNKGAARALDRVATTVTKEATDEIRKRLNLKAGDIKAAIRKVRPYGNQSLIRDVEARGNPLPLREYAARMTRRGATYQVKRGAPRKVYRRNMRTGFIIERFGRHVFVRTGPNPPGPEDAPIKKVFGPGITHYFQMRATRQRMLETAEKRWPIEFEREMRYRRMKAGL